MFPDYLDGAKVLEYTGKEHFGIFIDYDDDNNPIEKEICYFAICKYEDSPYGSDSYYLFGCDSQYDVITDHASSSIGDFKYSVALIANATWYRK